MAPTTNFWYFLRDKHSEKSKWNFYLCARISSAQILLFFNLKSFLSFGHWIALWTLFSIILMKSSPKVPFPKPSDLWRAIRFGAAHLRAIVWDLLFQPDLELIQGEDAEHMVLAAACWDGALLSSHDPAWLDPALFSSHDHIQLPYPLQSHILRRIFLESLLSTLPLHSFSPISPGVSENSKEQIEPELDSNAYKYTYIFM